MLLFGFICTFQEPDVFTFMFGGTKLAAIVREPCPSLIVIYLQTQHREIVEGKRFLDMKTIFIDPASFWA